MSSRFPRRAGDVARALLAMLVAGCAGQETTSDGGGDGLVEVGDAADVREVEAVADGADATDAPGDCPGPLACATACCDEAERCWADTCIPDNGTCGTDDECSNDTYCAGGVCIPYGLGDRGDFNPECRTEPEPLTSFDPEIQCEWPRPDEPGLPDADQTSVIVAPLIGDLDADGIPEVVFSSGYGAGVGTASPVRAIRGNDCSTAWSSAIDVDYLQHLALADLDADGRLEVCGRSAASVPFCLDHAGRVLWTGHDAAGADVAVETGVRDAGISVADVDGVPPPELIVGASVFDASTGLLAIRGPDIGPVNPFLWGTIPAVADVDGDGHLEALTGGRVVDLVDGTVAGWGVPDGYAAVAELDGDSPGPEVVAVSPSDGALRVHSAAGAVLWSVSVPGGSGGPPTVADLDGDGRAEFAAAGHSFLTAFDLDCAVDPPDPARCSDPDDADGIVWSVASHEFSSGVTGSSVFDFEGDGPVEVVYADECWARVFDGRTGTVKFSAPHNSGTAMEYVTVGDVDGDTYTEMVVPHDYYPGAACPTTDPLSPATLRDPARAYAGVTIYRDAGDRWAPSRPLWSQHAEHYSDRNDDGTVPAPEVASWTGHNSYRQNFPRLGTTAQDRPDLTAGDVVAVDCIPEEFRQPLSAEVCNRGTLPVAAGAAVTFRRDAPDGPIVCTDITDVALAPGECTRVACDWVGIPLEESHDVYVTADDDGSGGGNIRECLEGNNGGTAAAVRCPPIIG